MSARPIAPQPEFKRYTKRNFLMILVVHVKYGDTKKIFPATIEKFHYYDIVGDCFVGSADQSHSAARAGQRRIERKSLKIEGAISRSFNLKPVMAYIF